MNQHYVTLIFLAVAVASCGEDAVRIEIPFAATHAGSPVSCASDADLQLSDLRFYLHDLALIDANGKKSPITLLEDDWQQTNLALIDLEDGSGGCVNGTPEINSVARGAVSMASPAALEFTLGVPFEYNHRDPLTAAPPLGEPDMHWHWRGGYKFLRAGVKSESDSFWIHLGSTGCRGTIQNITACDAPNRVQVRIDDFSVGDVVAIDIAELVAGSTLADGEPGDCSSGPAETSCVAAFTALGLNHGTGQPSGTQRLFSLRSAP